MCQGQLIFHYCEYLFFNMYFITLLECEYLLFICISLVIIATIGRQYFIYGSKTTTFDTRLNNTVHALIRCSRSFISEGKKQLSIVIHLSKRHFQLTASKKRTSPSSSQCTSEKRHGLLEGVGTISHILCVVVYGRTQLFITFRRQLIESLPLPRLIGHKSSRSYIATVNDATTKDREFSQYGETRGPCAQNRFGFQHCNCPRNSHTIHESQATSTRQVVISPSPSPNGHRLSQSRHQICFRRHQMTDRIRYPHFDMDSRLLSFSPPRNNGNNGRGSERFVLLPSQRQGRGIRTQGFLNQTKQIRWYSHFGPP